MLSEKQIELYSRQILLPQVGGMGQERLLAKTVMVVGDGVLSDTFIEYVKRAGVGNVLVSGGGVCKSRTTETGNWKTRRNNEARSWENTEWDLGAVLDAPSREVQQVNRLCLQRRVPLIWAATDSGSFRATLCEGYRGDRPCAECYPRNDGASQTAGSFTLRASILGSWLAFEALKVLLDIRPSIECKIVHMEERRIEVWDTPLEKNALCVACAAETTNCSRPE